VPGDARATSQVLGRARRYLGSGSPGSRARAFGFARFDPAEAPEPEWRAFGSCLFAIPQVELCELSSCAVLSVNVVWDTEAAREGQLAEAQNGCVEEGLCSTFQQAIGRAREALAALRAPLPASKGRFAGGRAEPAHLPTREEWEGVVGRVVESLEAVTSGEGNALLGAPTEEQVEAMLAAVRAGGDGEGLLEDTLADLERLLAEPASSRPGDGSPSRDDSGARRAEESAGTASEGWGGDDAASEGEVARSGGLTKVVMARRTELALRNGVDALELMQVLQDRDPKAYQALVALPSGETFLSSTPERLFVRNRAAVASEAVAATRPRGHADATGDDLAFQLLASPKDHAEFVVVRDSVQRALEGACEDVKIEVEKEVLKHASVQHLYGRLAGRLGELPPGVDPDAALLEALHPTPAVAGHPREDAVEVVRGAEEFDRGLYAGPAGWISADAAEFAVAIRSALVIPAPCTPAASSSRHGRGGQKRESESTKLLLFSGVGLVQGSEPASEWEELSLKTRQFTTLFPDGEEGGLALTEALLKGAPNPNTLWCTLLVEELCRQGCSTFCVAPGSRSTPLALAAARHPRVRLVTCLDERALGFFALGHGRGSGRPACVVTTSGTAVAELLPSVVEASLQGVPLLLLTADRPPELLDCGANQTVDQTKIFGSYIRWENTLPPPDDRLPARLYLSAAAHAVARARGASPGPVHLNLPFREPLVPSEVSWNRRGPALEGLEMWIDSRGPFTQHVGIHDVGGGMGGADGTVGLLPRELLDTLRNARKGLLVIAGTASAAEAEAAAWLARETRWTCYADPASGLRFGNDPDSLSELDLLPYLDIALPGVERAVGGAAAEALAPDVAVVFGRRVVSKPVVRLVARATCVVVCPGAGGQRHDERHQATYVLEQTLPEVARSLAPAMAAAALSSLSAPLRSASSAALTAADSAVLQFQAVRGEQLLEQRVGAVVVEELPAGMALAWGNSCPVRDAAAFGPASSQACRGSPRATRTVVPRGASGIDGVVSFAAGCAHGMDVPTTLVVGDTSFLHDAACLHLLRSQGRDASAAGPPLVVVVVNNNGGRIFGRLPGLPGGPTGNPIVGPVNPDELERLFQMPPGVDLKALCSAFSVPYLGCDSEGGLRESLHRAWGARRPCVVEATVDSCSDDARREAEAQAAAAAQRVAAAWFQAASQTSMQGQTMADPSGLPVGAVRVSGWNLAPYRVALTRPTTAGGEGGTGAAWRTGAVLEVRLCGADGAEYVGSGEVATLPGLHEEDLGEAMVETAASAAALLASGRELHPAHAVEALGGALGSWLAASRARPSLPSARFAVEAALLSALAASRGVTLRSLLSCRPGSDNREGSEALAEEWVNVCGLVGQKHEGGRVEDLLKQGFRAGKVKVGPGTADDEKAWKSIRALSRGGCLLRWDANRKMSLKESLALAERFQAEQLEVSSGNRVPAGLDFFEEPCHEGLAAFCRSNPACPAAADETVAEAVDTAEAAGPDFPNVAVALPAALDALMGDAVRTGNVAALVLKPSRLGLEAASIAAEWGRARGLRCVVSSSFEGSEVGRSLLAELAVAWGEDGEAHGLGVGDWFASTPGGRGSAESPRVALPLVASPPSGQGVGEGAGRSQVLSEKHLENAHGRMRFLEVGPGQEGLAPLVFLHGFLGEAEDWEPVARALAATGRRVVLADLPGHGGSSLSCPPGSGLPTVESAAAAVGALLEELDLSDVVLVGYSLGARVALAAGAGKDPRVAAVVSVSGSPGLRDADERRERAERDSSLARALEAGGIESFTESWYRLPMFAPFVQSPLAPPALERRRGRGNSAALAGALEGMSPGRAAPVWGRATRGGELPVLFLAGELDAKFCRLAQAAAAEEPGGAAEMETLPGGGHALHLELPVALAAALSRFLARHAL